MTIVPDTVEFMTLRRSDERKDAARDDFALDLGQPGLQLG